MLLRRKKTAITCFIHCFQFWIIRKTKQKKLKKFVCCPSMSVLFCQMSRLCSVMVIILHSQSMSMCCVRLIAKVYRTTAFVLYKWRDRRCDQVTSISKQRYQMCVKKYRNMRRRKKCWNIWECLIVTDLFDCIHQS
jgi:hypothetical protein